MIDENGLAAAVRVKTEALQAELLAKLEANLSGDVLQERSGALKASIVSSLSATDGLLGVQVASVGVPYAAIQEEGGGTAPHEIVAVKARALAFAGVGGLAFARRVAHPGSVIPARRYMASALEALETDISSGLKQAVRDALGTD